MVENAEYSEYDMIFIDCNWVSTGWQWSVNVDTDRKEASIYKRRNSSQKNTKTQNIQNGK